MTVDEKLAARYGRTGGSAGRRIAVGLVVAAYLGVAAWAAFALSQRSVEANVLTWRAQPRAVQFDLEVRGSAPQGVDCVVKATDAQSVDVGYRTVTVPQSPGTYRLSIPTVVRAASVGVLGCTTAGEPLRVPPPDFPPGVAIPCVRDEL